MALLSVVSPTEACHFYCQAVENVFADDKLLQMALLSVVSPTEACHFYCQAVENVFADD